METYKILWSDVLINGPYSGVCCKGKEFFWFLQTCHDNANISADEIRKPMTERLYKIYPLDTATFILIDSINTKREEKKRGDRAKGGFAVTTSLNITSYMEKILTSEIASIIEGCLLSTNNDTEGC